MKKYVKWHNDEIETLRTKYGRTHIDNIIPLLNNRNRGDIHYKARKLGLKANKQITNGYGIVNHGFFQYPNLISSYYAGLLAADGNIKNNIPVVTLTQNNRDVILKYQKYLGNNNAIIERKYTTKIGCRYVYYVSFTSLQIVKDLEKNFNIVPKKSLVLKPPQNLERINALSFIMGLIDGDGYIYIKKPKKQKPYLCLGLIGTKEICNWTKSILGGIGKVRLRNDKNRKNDIYRFDCCCNQAIGVVKTLLSIKELYDIRFDRKWNKIYELGKILNVDF